MTRATVFVAYPWAAHDQEDYKSRYRTLETTHDVSFVFAEDRLTSDHLITKVEGMMVAADFCVFDLTDLNPNVMLEYGLARGLRLETYIAFNPREGGRDVPSDLRGFDSLRYGSLDEYEQRLDAFLAQALSAEERRRRQTRAEVPSRDQQQFDAERDSIAPTPILKKITSRGYWYARIRPVRYEPGRVRYRDLPALIDASKATRRSYSFPVADAYRTAPLRTNDSYGLELDDSELKESWRVFESGQFVQWRALPEDWLEEWFHKPPTKLVSSKHVIPVGAAAHLAEVLEFASRLGQALPGTDPLVVTVGAERTSDRALFAQFDLSDPALENEVVGCKTDMTAFTPRDMTFTREQLKAGWQPFALDLVSQFFARFGFDAGDARLRRWMKLGPAS